MTRTLFFLIATLVIATTAVAEPLSLPANGRFILRASAGKDLLNQCSRNTPTNVSGFWQPSQIEIDQLEAALPAFLAEREKLRASMPPGRTYHRQYVGFVRGGERYIYGNFYPGGVVERGEATDPVMVCDGGEVFWGLVYRPSTKTFDDIQFNGYA